MDFWLGYTYEQHQAYSEESFTGLGIEKSHSKTWFSHPSNKPKYEK